MKSKSAPLRVMKDMNKLTSTGMKKCMQLWMGICRPPTDGSDM